MVKAMPQRVPEIRGPSNSWRVGMNSERFTPQSEVLSPRGAPCPAALYPISRNIEEYSLVIPTSTDSQGRFLSHLVSGPPKARFRRAAEDLQREAANEQIFYNVTVFGREFHFRLRPNSRLVAPGATVEWQEDSDETHIEPLYGNCLYVGDITDLPNASVAISNCDGLCGWVSRHIIDAQRVMLALWLCCSMACCWSCTRLLLTPRARDFFSIVPSWRNAEQLAISVTAAKRWLASSTTAQGFEFQSYTDCLKGLLPTGCYRAELVSSDRISLVSWHQYPSGLRLLAGEVLHLGVRLPLEVLAPESGDQAGMIRTDKDEFFIEPLEKGAHEEEEGGGRTHVVYRRAAAKKQLAVENADILYKAAPQSLCRLLLSEPQPWAAGDAAGVLQLPSLSSAFEPLAVLLNGMQ
ncbi:A disintegrin and metalloproteinase with thrombospondin motifs 2 [Anas platyrhynchos]|uniref:A disintegrin and metalloproteinase with thrombospondin motifs 2 n=1 Tax=Anas platyrhynchos TaxID=8839 RepID=R0JLG3_ANAPL|nr:A disintegrin and metalloproteinase with thrombospondin motifs 2 [Anas platyrhynchos]